MNLPRIKIKRLIIPFAVLLFFWTACDRDPAIDDHDGWANSSLFFGFSYHDLSTGENLFHWPSPKPGAPYSLDSVEVLDETLSPISSLEVGYGQGHGGYVFSLNYRDLPSKYDPVRDDSMCTVYIRLDHATTDTASIRYQYLPDEASVPRFQYAVLHYNSMWYDSVHRSMPNSGWVEARFYK